MIWREIPPTAGLPPRIGDLLAGSLREDGLEGAIAGFLGVEEAQLECSGTACLLVAFDYLKSLSARRTVVVPGYTCPLVVRAAARAGLRVVACDLERGGFSFDEGRLKDLLGPDTLAIVATHFGGALTDVPSLRRLVEAIDPAVTIIEDAAQSFGATWRGRAVGTQAPIGLFSFAAGKGFTLFEGGCLIGETAAIREGLRAASRRLVPRAPLFEARRAVELAGYHLFYNPAGLSLTYGLQKRRFLTQGDELRAASDWFGEMIPLHPVGRWRRHVGQSALARYPAHLARTQARFREIVARIGQDLPTLDCHAPAAGAEPTGTFVFVTFPTAEQCRAALARLWPTGLGVAKLFVHAIGAYPYLRGEVEGETPAAADLAVRTLTITTSEHLGEVDLAAVLEGLRTAL